MTLIDYTAYNLHVAAMLAIDFFFSLFGEPPLFIIYVFNTVNQYYCSNQAMEVQNITALH